MKVTKKPSAALLERAAAVVPTATARDLEQIALLAERLQQMDGVIERIEKELRDAQENRRRLAEVDIPLLFDQAGVGKVTLANGCSVMVGTTYHPNVLAADRPKLLAWLRRNKFGDLIKSEYKMQFGMGEEAAAKKLQKLLEKAGLRFTHKEDVHPQTFKAFVREQMEAKANLPSFVDPHPVRTTTIK